MDDAGETIRRSYRGDGLAFPIPVLKSVEAEHYRTCCEELEARLGGRPRTIEVRQMHFHFPWAHGLATHPRILAAVSQVLGSDLLIWATELFAKPPEDATVSIGWHRDRPYLGIDPRWCATAWVALADSTVENGCMHAVPGADHRTRALDPRDAVAVVLRAGEMSLHDAEIWHGSGPNRSPRKRVGFAIRFLSPRAGPLRGRPPVMIARGTASREDYRLVEPPVEVGWESAVAALKNSARRHLDALLDNVRDIRPAASRPAT
ncbi:MAG: phytanoyl-CoA dioxygenase family protein [Planctomycetaceae bacterium]